MFEQRWVVNCVVPLLAPHQISLLAATNTLCRDHFVHPFWSLLYSERYGAEHAALQQLIRCRQPEDDDSLVFSRRVLRQLLAGYSPEVTGSWGASCRLRQPLQSLLDVIPSRQEQSYATIPLGSRARSRLFAAQRSLWHKSRPQVPIAASIEHQIWELDVIKQETELRTDFNVHYESPKWDAIRRDLWESLQSCFIELIGSRAPLDPANHGTWPMTVSLLTDCAGRVPDTERAFYFDPALEFMQLLRDPSKVECTQLSSFVQASAMGNYDSGWIRDHTEWAAADRSWGLSNKAEGVFLVWGPLVGALKRRNPTMLAGSWMVPLPIEETCVDDVRCLYLRARDEGLGGPALYVCDFPGY